ncbi:hypothetical protein BDB00DRAFT_927106 [Zychaea mexicana]|uniref:uncharacterized protein n=1 Tax=Zychaea mexicana TaxID=64656 RepID=UPI0022FE78DD|nr:uncharacterized protein BDB00DRAFT_927106 [Zychaea mexicana]KAI9496062.1 hypothetical protein BDB00DRAFT_927106 [Zychaea mexicana]
MNTTMTDNKFLFPTDDYMSDYAAVPPPYATKVELSEAPVLYQEAALSYLNTNATSISVGGTTPTTTTTDASTASMVDQSSVAFQQQHHHHHQQAQQLFPEVSVASQQMTPRPQQHEVCGFGMQRNDPDTPMSTLTSCCTSPAPAPMMNTSMANAPIGLGLLPCTPTSPSTSSPSPSSSASVSSSLAQCAISEAPRPQHQQQQLSSDSFYPEFLQYSRESYEEQQPNQQSSSGRKKRRNQAPCGNSDAVTPSTPPVAAGAAIDDVAENDSHQGTNSASPTTDEWSDHIKTEATASQHQPQSLISNSELRRQIHIQSEQKRRAQIKDGFEDLRNELPSCLNKKMSKVALLHRTVQHIQHLKSTQVSILAELERLVNENEQLRKFQEGVLQKQAIEKMYHMNAHPL